jgi:hypothetical protein
MAVGLFSKGETNTARLTSVPQLARSAMDRVG